MNWNDVLTRLKDARTWAGLIGVVNLVLSYVGAAPQVTQIVNAVVVLAAFVLFGIGIGAAVIRAVRR